MKGRVSTFSLTSIVSFPQRYQKHSGQDRAQDSNEDFFTSGQGLRGTRSCTHVDPSLTPLTPVGSRATDLSLVWAGLSSAPDSMGHGVHTRLAQTTPALSRVPSLSPLCSWVAGGPGQCCAVLPRPPTAPCLRWSLVFSPDTKLGSRPKLSKSTGEDCPHCSLSPLILMLKSPLPGSSPSTPL